MNNGVYTVDIYGYENMDNLAQGRSYIEFGRNGSLSSGEISYDQVFQLLIEHWTSNYSSKVRLTGSGLPQVAVYVNTNDKSYHHYEITIDLGNDTISWQYQLSSDGVTWDSWITGDSGTATSSLAGIDTFGLSFSKRLDQNASQNYSEITITPEPSAGTLIIVK